MAKKTPAELDREIAEFLAAAPAKLVTTKLDPPLHGLEVRVEGAKKSSSSLAWGHTEENALENGQYRLDEKRRALERKQRVLTRKAARVAERTTKAERKVTEHKAKIDSGAIATCQVCEGKWKLVRGKISLHGYTRPGYGFITGQCRGAQQLPWEVSCDVLPRWITEMRHLLDGTNDAIADHPRRTTFTVQGRVKYANGRPVYFGKRLVFENDIIDATDDRFPRAQKAALAELENRRERLQQEIARQTKRLASWQPKAG